MRPCTDHSGDHDWSPEQSAFVNGIRMKPMYMMYMLCIEGRLENIIELTGW